MGFMDKAGEAAKGRFAGHEDKIDGLVDRAQQTTGASDTTTAVPDHLAEGAEPAGGRARMRCHRPGAGRPARSGAHTASAVASGQPEFPG